MPTFTSIALENLLEPRVRDTQKKSFHWDRDESDPVKAGPRHLYISPALYATPDQAPIPDHSLAYPASPSPYVVNLKRRRAGKVGRVEVLDFPSENELCVLSLDEVGENLMNEEVAGNAEAGEEEEGFRDPRSVAVSLGSEMEGSDFSTNQIESRSFVSDLGEFFVAIEDSTWSKFQKNLQNA